jgi:hypothetical protein
MHHSRVLYPHVPLLPAAHLHMPREETHINNLLYIVGFIKGKRVQNSYFFFFFYNLSLICFNRHGICSRCF